jgi:hypothetical protein
VIRRSAKREPIDTIVARVERTRSPDPSYANAEALWTTWLDETGRLRRFRWIFDRQYLGRGLDLDAREGVMRADGTLGPDPRITAEKIREFRRLTGPIDNPRENPQQVFDRLFGRG